MSSREMIKHFLVTLNRTKWWDIMQHLYQRPRLNVSVECESEFWSFNARFPNTDNLLLRKY